MRRYIKRHPLIAFFAVALAIKWGAESVTSLSGTPLIYYVAVGWSPSIAGLVVASAAGGTAGLRQLWDQALRWRAPLRWYLFVFVGFTGLVFFIRALSTFFMDATFSLGVLGVGSIVPTFVLIFVTGVPGEELFGWRGFALPRMLDRWGDLTASVLLGTGWWLWHQPRGKLIVSLSPLADEGIFFVGVLGLSILMTWVYRNTGSALLAGVGLHSVVYFPEFYTISSENIPIPGLNYYLATVLALIVVAVYGTKRFSRDPPESPEEEPPSPASSQ